MSIELRPREKYRCRPTPDETEFGMPGILTIYGRDTLLLKGDESSAFSDHNCGNIQVSDDMTLGLLSSIAIVTRSTL